MMPPNFAVSALYAMDNLELMRGMDSETVQLIYADPPFNSKRIYQGMPGSRAAGHRFRDTWSWHDAKEEWRDQIANDWPAIGHLVEAAKAHSDGMAGYLAFMAVRVIEMQRILRQDGSLYLHCDPTASGYLRALLDIVFGSQQFRNEIVWCYTGPSNTARWFPRKHDTIMFYAKSPGVSFNRDSVRVSYSASFQQRRRYTEGESGITGGYSEGRTDAEVSESFGAGKVPEDWWSDIPGSGQISRKERTGWSTQKPLALLERIIKASSNAGDIVFDPFCGCGTALVAAEQLGRQWVGADDDANAVSVIRERIANLTGTIGDGPQMQHSVSVIMHPPERTASVSETVYKDPTGYIVPKMPSDKMSNEVIRQQLMAWQTEQDGLITCPGCAERLRPRHFQCDHINPKSAGGTNRIDNRVMICGACHGEKGNAKALPALWTAHGVKGKARRRMQGLLAETQSKAQVLVRQLDAGALLPE